MPLKSDWEPASRTYIRENVPEKKGIYELCCFGKLVYIGRSTNLKRRLLEHCAKRKPNKFRVKTLRRFQKIKKHEDKHLTAYKQEHGSLPPWNKRDTRTKKKRWLLPF